MSETPLQIALQEYSYWRDCHNGEPSPSGTLLQIQIGALGASANIAARIAGANPEGVRYHKLTDAEIVNILTLTAAAPELLEALHGALNNATGMAAYLATCATPTILENLETTIATLHKQAAEYEAAIRKARGIAL